MDSKVFKKDIQMEDIMIQIKINDAIVYLSISRIDDTLRKDILTALEDAKKFDYKKLINLVHGTKLNNRSMNKDERQDIENLINFYLKPILNIIYAKEVYNYGSDS